MLMMWRAVATSSPARTALPLPLAGCSTMVASGRCWRTISTVPSSEQASTMTSCSTSGMSASTWAMFSPSFHVGITTLTGSWATGRRPSRKASCPVR